MAGLIRALKAAALQSTAAARGREARQMVRLPAKVWPLLCRAYLASWHLTTLPAVVVIALSVAIFHAHHPWGGYWWYPPVRRIPVSP